VPAVPLGLTGPQEIVLDADFGQPDGSHFPSGCAGSARKG
jgi:hypothetical protein